MFLTRKKEFAQDLKNIYLSSNEEQAMQNLNAQFKRLNRNKRVFPTKSYLEKALYLSIEKVSKK